jgi:hypothetical protein
MGVCSLSLFILLKDAGILRLVARSVSGMRYCRSAKCFSLQYVLNFGMDLA